MSLKIGQILFFFFFFFFFVFNLIAGTTPESLLKKIDELYRSKSSIAKIEMNVETPDWSRTIKMDLWTRGMDYTFVRIKEPRKDKGVSSLRRKNKMWNFFPKINKVIKVPPSMLMGSWMGSDFTNDDLVKNSSLIRDYITKIISSNSDNIVLSLIPKENTASVWGKIIIKIEKKSLLPISQEFFDEKGAKIRVMYFKEVKKMGGRIIPTVLELVPLTKSKKGHKTIVRYLEINFNKNVSKSVFTRTNLEKRR